MEKMSHIIVGKNGEAAAGFYLKKNKYRIRHTNYRCKIGEIDIVAQQRDNIIFVEVKTRKDNTFGYPSEAVTYYKQRKISKVALWYLQEYELFDYNVRFDVVEVWDEGDTTAVHHIINAFEMK
ncbi:MAG: YraN family protein [Eubacteriales bacterium]